MARERTTHQTNSTHMMIFMEGGKPENLEKNPRGKGENNTSHKLNSHVDFYGERKTREPGEKP